MKFFVVVRGWATTTDAFRTRLFERWPGVTPELPTGDVHTLRWEGPEIQEGRLMRDGEAIVLHGEVHACARVAVWFRSFVPGAVPVIFFDESYGACLDVSPGLGADELAERYLLAANR